MQALSVTQGFNFRSTTEFSEISANFEDDFQLKLRLNDQNITNELDKPPQEAVAVKEKEEEQQEDEEEEFSFCAYPDGSPISADDIFLNGQIRPVLPLFNRDLFFGADGDSEVKTSVEPALRPPLKKLFVEERDHASSTSSSSSEGDEPEGPYCAWAGKAVEASPEVKKSNSTGFSKLRRFRELVRRSNSDGKDAFVFLNNITSTITTASTKACRTEKNGKVVVEEKKKKPAAKKGKNGETASSAHEKLYVRNRAIKEEFKRKSYLPYRVGFFTNANGLSRNVHPY